VRRGRLLVGVEEIDLWRGGGHDRGGDTCLVHIVSISSSDFCTDQLSRGKFDSLAFLSASSQGGGVM
jgi:hypothetical protein